MKSQINASEEVELLKVEGNSSDRQSERNASDEKKVPEASFAATSCHGADRISVLNASAVPETHPDGLDDGNSVSPATDTATNSHTVDQAPEPNDVDVEERGTNRQPLGVVLPSRIRCIGSIIALDILCVLASTFIFYYIIEALTVREAKLGALLFSPSKTVAIVNGMATILLVLLTMLCHMVLEALKWQMASRRNGARVTTFLSLSSATTLLGAIRLMTVRGLHYFWCLLRQSLHRR